jgi:prophage antirepressor-like protein
MEQNQVSVFESVEFGSVRTVTVNGEPMFVAKDVAEALGYANTRDAISKHCKAKADVAIHDGSQNREMSVIPEREMFTV